MYNYKPVYENGVLISGPDFAFVPYLAEHTIISIEELEDRINIIIQN